MKTLKLGNAYIPRTTPTVTARQLSRLRADELLNIALLWLTIPQASPKPSKELLRAMGFTKEEFINDYKEWLARAKKQKVNSSKRRIVDKLIVDVYPQGLNLLQLATLDSQLLVSKPNAYPWMVSQVTARDTDRALIVSIEEPQVFLQSLVDTLSTIYLTHIYISRHPHYPLILIRIQLFDLMGAEQATDSVISKKPVLIGVPMNSDKILLSQTVGINDTASEFVMHALEAAISRTLNREVQILLDPTSTPIQNLESAFIIAGNSRFTASLGPWAPYAAGEVDISPFDDVQLHDTFRKPEYVPQSDLKKRIAMMRFKGNVKKSHIKVYEGGKKRRKRETIQIGQNEDDNDDIEDDEDDEYASIVPIQQIEFEIKNTHHDFQPSLKLSFQGSDVFGGLHELCDRGLADSESIPGWLTGETIASGVIDDGVYSRKKKLQSSTTTDNGALI